VFDLDGTLVDSLGDLAAAMNILLTEMEIPALGEAAIGAMVGDGAAMLVTRAFAASGRPAPAGALDRFLAIYDQGLLIRTRPYPDIPQVLATLAGTRPLAVLTNKPRAATRRILDGLGLSSHFDPAAIVGGDGPLPRKPDPSGLRQLADRVGVALDQTVLVGDSRVDQRTARAAGTGLCVARYGFGFDPAVVTLHDDELAVDAAGELLRLL
jgi:phosphoglycolate phosphatase